MEKEILFSIVIPTYNRADFIAKTINSVLQQSYPNFEIIVVDDGSKDSTGAIVQRIDDKRVNYYLKENGERGAARNYGAKIAKGDYINFFDSDDLLYPNHLATALEMAKENNEPEVFHLGYDIRDVNSTIARKVNLPNDLNQGLLSGNCLSCNGVFVRKDVTQEYSFHEDRNLAASEDYLLWLRLAARFNIFSSQKITSTIIEHENRSVLSMTNASKLVNRKELMLKFLFEDKTFMQKHGEYRRRLISDAYSYVALHLAMTKKNKKTSSRYLWKSILANPYFIGTRRFLATVKYLLAY